MQKDVQRSRHSHYAFIFSASTKQHKNWSVLFCRSNATSFLLSHLHTLRIHQPLLRITETLTCVLRSAQWDQNVSLLLQKCKQRLISFFTAVLAYGTVTQGTTQLKKGLLSVSGHIDVREQGRLWTRCVTMSSKDSDKILLQNRHLCDGSTNSLQQAIQQINRELEGHQPEGGRANCCSKNLLRGHH